MLFLFAPLLGGAAGASVTFVPGEDGEDGFRASVRVIASESGPICDPGGPTLAAITGDICSVCDEGDEGDLLDAARRPESPRCRSGLRDRVHGDPALRGRGLSPHDESGDEL